MTLFNVPGKQKTGKHNIISIRSYRNYSKESLLERLKKDLPDYSTFNCMDAAYIGLTTDYKTLVMKLHR